MENMDLAYQLGWQSRENDDNPMSSGTLEFHMWNLGRMDRGRFPMDRPLAAHPDPEILNAIMQKKELPL